MGSVVSSVVGSVTGLLGGGGGNLGTGRAGLDAAQAQGLQASQDILNQLKQVQPQQQQFAAALGAGALGQGPSIADAQLQSAMSRNLQQQMAAAQANRAVNPALANRQLMNNAAQVQRDTANAGVTARLQEQQQKQQQFQNYISSQQGASANFLGGGTQAASANAQAQGQQQDRQNNVLGGLLNAGASAGMAFLTSDKTAKKDIKYYAEGGVVDPYQQPATPLLQQLMQQQFLSSKPADFGKEGSQLGSQFGTALKQLMASKPGTTMAGGPMDAGGGAAMTGLMAAAGGKVPGTAEVSGNSLKNDKVPAMLSPGEVVVDRETLQKGDKAILKFVKKELKGSGQAGGKMAEGGKAADFNPQKFLDALQATSYNYKDPSATGASEGRHLSVMAQDLEKAGPVGKSMVEEGPDGKKMVNYAAGFGAILAAQAHLNKRLNEIESMGKKSEAKKDK